MKVVPYTTPKGVKIGLAYEPPRRVEPISRDMECLQVALLGTPAAPAREAMYWVGGVALLVAIPFAPFLWELIVR